MQIESAKELQVELRNTETLTTDMLTQAPGAQNAETLEREELT